MLTNLEAVFRSLKSELGMRPVHHQLADRVSGHLFITVLAYHLVHTIRIQAETGTDPQQLVCFKEDFVNTEQGDSVHAV
jgi:transposase